MAAVEKPSDPALFCTSGTTSVPAASRIADGWKGPAAPGLDGDVPPAEEINWKHKADGDWNAWTQAHAAARFESLDDAVAAKAQGWLGEGSSFTLERLDATVVGDRRVGLVTSRDSTELRADGELVLQIAGADLETLERDVSGKTVRFTSSETIGRLASAGLDVYIADATGGSRRVQRVSRSTWSVLNTLTLAVGQDPVALATDRGDVYIARANDTVERYDGDLTANAWGAAYNHGADILDMATDGEFVLVAGHDRSGGGTDHLVGLRRTSGVQAWGATLPGGVNARATAVETDGRFVYVASFDGSSGDSTVSKVCRVSGEVLESRTFSSLEAIDLCVDAELVAVVFNDAGTNNVQILDKLRLGPVALFDFDGIGSVKPTAIASDSDRIYLGGESGALDGEAQWISRGTTPSTWVVDDLGDPSALLGPKNLRYSNVFTPGER